MCIVSIVEAPGPKGVYVCPSSKFQRQSFRVLKSGPCLCLYRQIFVDTFCFINICISLYDDTNRIKTLNIERA